jgi:hypothetical protein
VAIESADASAQSSITFPVEGVVFTRACLSRRSRQCSGDAMALNRRRAAARTSGPTKPTPAGAIFVARTIARLSTRLSLLLLPTDSHRAVAGTIEISPAFSETS